MSAYVELHPVNPQARLVDKVVRQLTAGGLIAYPTDSGYALACTLGNKEGLDRIRQLRQLGEKHNFTLVAESFTQLGQMVIVSNAHFRLIKSLTPGPYTFIVKGTKEIPRMTLHPKKHTVGFRIPRHTIAQAIVAGLGEPVLSSTLLLPGDSDAMSEGWVVRDELGHLLDMVVEGPVDSTEPTTVLNLTDDVPVLERQGSGPVDGILA